MSTVSRRTTLKWHVVLHSFVVSSMSSYIFYPKGNNDKLLIMYRIVNWGQNLNENPNQHVLIRIAKSQWRTRHYSLSLGVHTYILKIEGQVLKKKPNEGFNRYLVYIADKAKQARVNLAYLRIRPTFDLNGFISCYFLHLHSQLDCR